MHADDWKRAFGSILPNAHSGNCSKTVPQPLSRSSAFDLSSRRLKRRAGSRSLQSGDLPCFGSARSAV